MTSFGFLVASGAAAVAVLGAIAYLVSRRTPWQSRGMALVLFGHGALGTAGLLLLISIAHVHEYGFFHFHAYPESIVAALACDLDWSCVSVIAGGVAATVVGTSFVLSQVIARTLIRRAMRLGARPLSATASVPATVLLLDRPVPDACSVAILSRGGPLGVRFRNFVIVTTGLLEILSPDEVRAVLEHEVAHIRSKDARYLPYFHFLSALVFFDPVVRHLRNRLSRRYEFQADEAAARATRSPRTLACALWKVWEASYGRSGTAGFLGRRRACEILERIEHLLTLAESMQAEDRAT